ncbi:MAG: NnrU family protein [Hylemonella sp.]|uniref:NnrU family protein n=1 Tax=Hylemonella sp. TaxID=2066020 RepID=UPI0022C62189|nr:NnrU family protein [Hylemonella sp.]MCZ8252851.1 NnrU family protein [Hylemonella sp.]
MMLLIAGLVIFLGVHSLRMLAPAWRERMRGQLGEGTWKGLYSLLSLIGLAMVAWGFDLAREQPMLLWSPPTGMRHAASMLTLLAFILVAAAYVPGNHLKARLGHPMVLGVKAWALAHLLATGMLAHLLLFGAFLLWAVANYAISRRRDRREGVVYPPGKALATVITLLLGVAGWAAFAFGLHGLLIGIKPFG